jgi:hypothetical protein
MEKMFAQKQVGDGVAQRRGTGPLWPRSPGAQTRFPISTASHNMQAFPGAHRAAGQRSYNQTTKQPSCRRPAPQADIWNCGRLAVKKFCQPNSRNNEIISRS